MPTNKINIVLLVEKAPGILGRVTNLVLQQGFKFQKHNFVPEGDAQRLTLELEGNIVSMSELSSQLGSMPGVLKVISIKDTTKNVQIDSKSNAATQQIVAQYSSDLIIAKIVESWAKPNTVLEIVQTFEDKLKVAQRASKVTDLGESVGKRLATDYDKLQEVDSIEAALEEVVMPIIKTLANGEVDGNLLKVPVSLFSRRYLNSMDLIFGSEQDRCYFLAGLIQGLISQCRQLPKLYVKETKCRANGDRACLFKIVRD